MGLYDRDYMRAPRTPEPRGHGYATPRTPNSGGYDFASGRDDHVISLREWLADQMPLGRLRATLVFSLAIAAVSIVWSIAVRDVRYWEHATWLHSHFTLDAADLPEGRYQLLILHALLCPWFWHGLLLGLGLFFFMAVAERRTGPFQVSFVFLAGTIAGGLAHLFFNTEFGIRWAQTALAALQDSAIGQRYREAVAWLIRHAFEAFGNMPMELNGPAAGIAALIVVGVFSRPVYLRRTEDFYYLLSAAAFIGLDWPGVAAIDGGRISLGARLGGILVAIAFLTARAVLRRVRRLFQRRRR